MTSPTYDSIITEIIDWIDGTDPVKKVHLAGEDLFFDRTEGSIMVNGGGVKKTLADARIADIPVCKIMMDMSQEACDLLTEALVHVHPRPEPSDAEKITKLLKENEDLQLLLMSARLRYQRFEREIKAGDLVYVKKQESVPPAPVRFTEAASAVPPSPASRTLPTSDAPVFMRAFTQDPGDSRVYASFVRVPAQVAPKEPMAYAEDLDFMRSQLGPVKLVEESSRQYVQMPGPMKPVEEGSRQYVQMPPPPQPPSWSDPLANLEREILTGPPADANRIRKTIDNIFPSFTEGWDGSIAKLIHKARQDSRREPILRTLKGALSAPDEAMFASPPPIDPSIQWSGWPDGMKNWSHSGANV